MKPPCFECGEPSDHEHHVVPRSRGGTKTVPLCERCHGRAHGHRMNVRVLTREALATKRAAGQALGKVPYGFRRGRILDPLRPSVRAIEPCREEQRVLARARELDEGGFSFRKIRDALEAEGFRNREGRAFALASVHTMLTPDAHEKRRTKRATA